MIVVFILVAENKVPINIQDIILHMVHLSTHFTMRFVFRLLMAHIFDLYIFY